ncbi:MAG: MFS transporter [Pseudomonadota bacterium]|nr:MFS transporter [Pseudomonadota bacterium]
MTKASPETQFYRWVILFCSFLVLFVTNGMTLGGIAVFDLQILNALQESSGDQVPLADLKFRDFIMFAVGGSLGLLGGWLADRVGVKPLFIIGLALMAFCNFAYSQVQSLIDIYWIHAGYGVVLVLAGLMLNVYLVSRWFEKRRGLAIGILLSGSSLGNAFFPQLNTWLLATYSWQDAFVWLAMIPVALLPLAIFVLRSSPKNSNQNNSLLSNDDELTGYTLTEALLSRNFWIIGSMAFCTFYSIIAMSATTFNFLSAENYSPQISATGVTVLFIGGLVGKLISGQLAESLGRKRILLFSLTLMLSGSIGLVLAVFLKHEFFIWVGLVGFGFGWGGIYTLIQLLSADIFGLKSLGKILGAVNVLDTLGAALGPWVTALLLDRTGSFLASFVLITVLLIIATVVSAFLDISKAAYLQKNATSH